MSYTDDAVKAKLSALNETQEAIVTVAQWIMFHRKYAQRTAELWLERLRESASMKRLNLIYLANEVVQQSKARKKIDFLAAFAPILPEATAIAYKGATLDIQQKIRRVTEVWRQRIILDPAIQQDIETRIDEIDRSRGGGKRPALGGSLFSSAASSAPSEYQAVLASQAATSKSEAAAKPAVTDANTEYEKHNNPSTITPAPPIYAARLGALLKSLATAEGAVAQSIKARKTLMDGLEKLLTKNREDLALEESQLYELNSRKTEIELKRDEVEKAIMAGLADPASNGGMEPQRPDAEPLTPPMPPVESITPTGTPTNPYVTSGTAIPTSNPARLPEPEPLNLEERSATNNGGTSTVPAPLAGISSDPRKSRNASFEEPLVKRRKVSGTMMDDDFTGLTDDAGIDADVEALLAP